MYYTIGHNVLHYRSLLQKVTLLLPVGTIHQHNLMKTILRYNLLKTILWHTIGHFCKKQSIGVVHHYSYLSVPYFSTIC